MSRSNTEAQTSLPIGSLSQFSPVFLKIHLLFLYIVGSLDKIDIYDYQFMVQKQLLKFYLSILPELLCKIHSKKRPKTVVSVKFYALARNFTAKRLFYCEIWEIFQNSFSKNTSSVRGTYIFCYWVWTEDSSLGYFLGITSYHQCSQHLLVLSQH